MVASVFQLQCSCNNYPWGRVGKDSLAATLCSKTPNTSFKIEGKPYAEMWMGDYPVLPAKDLNGEELHSIIDKNKFHLLGKNTSQKFGGVLPFLPKILSIAKALTLQIHPNKELSEKFHREKPDQFTDPNHKPEIAIALGPFELFAGFKQTRDIQSVFEAVPALKKFVPQKQSGDWNNETVREICRNILLAEDESIRNGQEALEQVESQSLGTQAYVKDLLPRLQGQYAKEDPGTLVALLTMNYLSLDKGDAVYVPADAPHAYLSGNIVECMARSNNVLNTGFCPKAERDNIDVFTNALTFSSHNDNDVILKAERSPRGSKGRSQVYAPPLSEFSMLRTQLNNGESETIESVDGPTVLFVTSGGGTMDVNSDHFELKEGYVFFVGAGLELQLQGDTTPQFEVWQANAQ